jgi:hypothetical protein
MAKPTATKTRKTRVPRKRKPQTAGLAPADCHSEITGDLAPIADRVKKGRRPGGAEGALRLAYFMVANCDAGVAKAKELGGSVKVPPMNIPKVGRFAAIADPQGAVFAIINLTPNR